VIVCLRTVIVPAAERGRYLEWIADARSVREDHGILAELVLEPVTGGGETVVITIWPSHEVFDAWIATPDRDRLTASDVHAAVDYRPITRYDVAGGYLNLAGLAEVHESYPEPPCALAPSDLAVTGGIEASAPRLEPQPDSQPAKEEIP
jgi:heme-degrading monooxygenase HmoA